VEAQKPYFDAALAEAAHRQREAKRDALRQEAWQNLTGSGGLGSGGLTITTGSGGTSVSIGTSGSAGGGTSATCASLFELCAWMQD
jgi:hypothetical protein